MPKIKLHQFKKSSLIILAVVAFIAYKWMTGPSGIVNQINLYKSNKELMAQIDELNVSKESLDEERERLRHDTLYLEKVVRSELGMAKPGETVYRLVEQNQNTSAPITGQK